MKTKEVEVGEQKYKIASLTVDQYAEYIGDGVTIKGKEFIRKHMVPIVAASLRNAEEGNGDWFDAGQWNDSEGTKWSPKRASSAFSFAELQSLYQEIIPFSGLKTTGVTQGEGAAVAGSQPNSSAAA